MVDQGQLVEIAVSFSDLQAYEELIISFIRQKSNNIMLRQQTFLIFMNKTFQFMVFTLAKDHFTVRPSSGTLTFRFTCTNVSKDHCAKLL